MTEQDARYDNFEKSRAKLTEAFEQWQSQLTRAHYSEVENKDRRIAELEAEVAQLKKDKAECYKENATLFARLAAAIEAGVGPPSRPSTSGYGSGTSAGSASPAAVVITSVEDTVPLADYAVVVGKVNRLCKRLQANEIALERLNKKAHDYKASCRDWKAYADKCYERLKKKNLDSAKVDDQRPRLVESPSVHQDLLAGPKTEMQYPGSADVEAGKSNIDLPDHMQRTEHSTSRATRPDTPCSPSLTLVNPTVTEASPVSPTNRHQRRETKLVASQVAANKKPAATCTGLEEIASRIVQDHASATIDPTSDKAENQRSEQSSSQTTEDEQSERLCQAANAAIGHTTSESGHGSTMHSSKKRKRSSDDSILIHEDATNWSGTQSNPIQVKAEPMISPTMMPPPSKRQLHRSTTIDLDEVGNKVDTPRKRKRREEILRRAKSFRVSAIDFQPDERSTSVPRDDDAIPELDLTRERIAAPLQLERSNSDPLIKVEGEAYSEVVSTPFRDYHMWNNRSERHQMSRALHSIDGNQRILPRTSELSKSSRRRQNRSLGSKAIHTLTEDGLSYRPGSHPPAAAQRTSPYATSKGTDRLSSLLSDSTVPARHPVSPKGSAANRGAGKAVASDMSVFYGRRSLRDHLDPAKLVRETDTSTSPSSSRQEQNDDITRSSGPTTKSLPPCHADQAVTPRQQQAQQPLRLAGLSTCNRENNVTPPQALVPQPQRPPPLLRFKPIDQLRLEDFKPNPYARPYTSNAVDDRNRDNRRHLPGCVDPACAQGCYTAMQALATSLPITVPHDGRTPRRVWDDLPEADRLLRWHLGSSYDTDAAVTNPDHSRRAELLIAARMKVVADMYGRHRVAPFERQKSPPGFWRAEMPSTQELVRDREEAKKLEAERVGERWREAMREGGLWKFRDE